VAGDECGKGCLGPPGALGALGALGTHGPGLWKDPFIDGFSMILLGIPLLS